MNEIIFITEAAEEDLFETVLWYEKQKSGLGEQEEIFFAYSKKETRSNSIYFFVTT